MITLKCIIISSQQTRIYNSLGRIKVPLEWGVMEILPKYVESFAVLGSGEVVLSGDIVKKVKITGGECYVKDNVVTIIL